MKKKDKTIFFGVVAIIVVLIVVNNLPEITFNVPSGDTTILVPEGQSPSDPTTPYVPPPPAPSGIAPSSLMVSFEDTTIEMGDELYGTVVSDGKDYPFTIHALHVGTGIEQTYGGLLGDNGKFYDYNTMYIPGYWDFWATTDTVTSNMPRVTVEGVLIVPERTHYSKTFGGLIDCELFSHTSGNAQIIAIDAEAMVMIPMTSAVIHTNGYGTVALDFSPFVFSSGTYEITVLINGLDSADFGANPMITVGR